MGCAVLAALHQCLTARQSQQQYDIVDYGGMLLDHHNTQLNHVIVIVFTPLITTTNIPNNILFLEYDQKTMTTISHLVEHVHRQIHASPNKRFTMSLKCIGSFSI